MVILDNCVDMDANAKKVEIHPTSLSDMGSFDENNDRMIEYPVSPAQANCKVNHGNL